jgi:DNA topoisomerase III
MKIAEALYNRGIISYPRTETDVFAPTFELRSLIERQCQDPNWGTYAGELLNGKFRFPRKGTHNDEAHPPIHPVRSELNLTGDEKKVFDFITRRFLACCSHDAKGLETVITLGVSTEEFTAKGLMISERNYLEVYPYESWSGSMVGAFEQGEILIPAAINIKSGSTSVPKMLTEADLITLMDNAGIGTDATIHEHIKKILNREYALIENNFFYPTTLGMALVTGYDKIEIDFSLSKPELRALMEQNMKQICDGSKSKQSVVDDILRMYKRAFINANDNLEGILNCFSAYMAQVPLNEVNVNLSQVRHENILGDFIRICKNCGNNMYLRHIKPNEPRKFVSCSGYPNCRESIWFLDGIYKVEVDQNNCTVCSIVNSPVMKAKLEFTAGVLPPTYQSPVTDS